MWKDMTRVSRRGQSGRLTLQNGLVLTVLSSVAVVRKQVALYLAAMPDTLTGPCRSLVLPSGEQRHFLKSPCLSVI